MSASSPRSALGIVAARLLLASVASLLLASVVLAPPALAQPAKEPPTPTEPVLPPETVEDVERQLDEFGTDPTEDEERRNTELWEEYKRYRDKERSGYTTTGERVNFGADVTVSEGERVAGDVVSIGGSAIIYGAVEGDVVSIGGSVILHDGAFVDGDVVSVGGRIEELGEVEVTGERVSIDLGFNVFSRGFGHGPDFRFPKPKYLSLGFDLAWIAVGLLVGFVFYAVAGRRLEIVSRRVETEPGQSFLIGLLGAFGTPFAFVVTVILLVLTVIGILLIPIAVILLFLMITGGFLAVSLAVGRRLAHLRSEESLPIARSPYFYLTVGYVALYAVSLVGSIFEFGGGFLQPFSMMLGILGFFIAIFASILGYGALLTSRFGSAPATTPSWQSATPVIPPPPPGSSPPSPRGGPMGPVARSGGPSGDPPAGDAPSGDAPSGDVEKPSA